MRRVRWRNLLDSNPDFRRWHENMARGSGGAVEDLATGFRDPFLGNLPFDETLEDALGAPDRILQTPFAIALRSVSERALLQDSP